MRARLVLQLIIKVYKERQFTIMKEEIYKSRRQKKKKKRGGGGERSEKVGGNRRKGRIKKKG